MRLLACTLAFLALAAPALAPAQAKVTVADKTMGRTTPKVEIKVHYPVTGRPAMDTLFADYVRDRIKETGQPGPRETNGASYYVSAAYTVTRNDDQLFSVLFSVEEYSGGAHPIHFQESFHFLMPEGARIYLPELVDGARGMARLSDLAITDLNRRLMKGPDPMTNADWIRAGAAPSYLAQIAFDWTPKELVLHFGEYAVAPYAAGPQEVRLPMRAFARIVRANPRAPAASFDCAKAASAIEKAVCGDAALARLDRQVAEAYGRKRVSEADAKAKVALLEGQRAFLMARDKSCGGDGACLAKAYRQRLAVLEPPPPS
jgi:uncharacterized protein YecT (DUF1311 family)